MPSVSTLWGEACDIPGATVVRALGAELDDPRIAPIMSFPAALDLVISLGSRADADVDASSLASAEEAAR